MTDDNFKILKIFKEHKGVFDVNTLIEAVFQDIKTDLLTPSDIALLKLVFSDNPTQEALDKCLENYDIEVVGGHKALMLAYFMKMHPELVFPPYVLPRLKGLLQFYRFSNIKLFAHYSKIARLFNSNNIDFLIFKGGCLRHLRPDFPRVMGDIDILVRENDYNKCSQIVSEMGYSVSSDIHSFDIHLKDSIEGIMDIHKYIILESECEKEFLNDLFSRATKQNVFGVQALVPSNEDMFFISLVNMARNLKNRTSQNGVLFNLFDCKFLLESKPDFDFSVLSENIRKTKTEAHISFALQFLNNIVPNVFGDLKIYKSIEKVFRNYCVLFVFQRYFLLNMKQKSHTMKITDVFSNPKTFFDYIQFKPVYFFFKQKFIKNSPFWAEFILKRYYDNKREIERV